MRSTVVIMYLAVVLGTLMAGGPMHAGEPPPAGLVEMRAFAKNLLAEGMYGESIEAYRAVVAVTADDPRSHYELAGALGFVRRYAEAIEAIQRAIVLKADDARYYELAAIAHQQLRQFEEAMAATQRGAELGDIKAMYTLAGMYEHGRGTDASPALALKWLQKAAESGHLGAMDGMARVYTDGLYGQAPNTSEAHRWRTRLERELAR